MYYGLQQCYLQMLRTLHWFIAKRITYGRRPLIIAFCYAYHGLGPVSRKSRNFTGHFRMSQFPLYLKNREDLRRQTSQLFFFLLSWKLNKRSAFQNKRLAVSQMAFRARKVFGTFEKQAPGEWIMSLFLSTQRKIYVASRNILNLQKQYLKNYLRLSFTHHQISRQVFTFSTPFLGDRNRRISQEVHLFSQHRALSLQL